MSLESYAHKAAKATVVQWFRDAAENQQVDFAKACGCRWMVNRGAPHWGVWEEYPVLPDRTGLDPVWDEFAPKPNYYLFLNGPPSYQYLAENQHHPAVIMDAAIQHKGSIVVGIEIVYKHPPHKEKLSFLKSGDLHSLLVLPASWVLGQIGPPTRVPGEFWAWSDSYFRWNG